MTKAFEGKLHESGSLIDRLQKCNTIISNMCKEGRPPKMAIPARWDDEDVFITMTITEAIDCLRAFDYLASKSSE